MNQTGQSTTCHQNSVQYFGTEIGFSKIDYQNWSLEQPKLTSKIHFCYV